MSQPAAKWSYDGETGPAYWDRNYPNAARNHQSPININTETALFDPQLAQVALNFTYDENCFKFVENTGHSFNVTGLPNAFSRVSGGPLEYEYKFLQFHVHWGLNENEGSEHLVDGESYAAELHLVNWNSQLYKAPGDAALSNNHDGLAVLGVFFKAGQHNPELDKILSALSQVPLKGQKTALKEQLDFRSLFPSNSSYWTYLGSLTTPPCSESVQWIVFREPVEVSTDQLAEFRKLFHCSNINECSDGARINYNFRPVCQLNNRRVFKSFEN